MEVSVGRGIGERNVGAAKREMGGEGGKGKKNPRLPDCQEKMGARGGSR